MRGYRQVLNALRETQLEQGQQINGLRQELRAGFAMQANGIAQVTALLTKITNQESSSN